MQSGIIYFQRKFFLKGTNLSSFFCSLSLTEADSNYLLQGCRVSAGLAVVTSIFPSVFAFVDILSQKTSRKLHKGKKDYFKNQI